MVPQFVAPSMHETAEKSAPQMKQDSESSSQLVFFAMIFSYFVK